jgi:hypothetical protein
MAMNRGFRKIVRLGIVSAFVTFAALFGQSKAGAQEPTGQRRISEATRVRVLLAIDYDANPRLVGIDMVKRSILSALKPDLGFQRDDPTFAGLAKVTDRITVEELPQHMMNPDDILGYYRSLRVDPDEAIVFWYAGHGGTDRVHGHFLGISGGSLERSRLVEVMTSRNARLTVILTDCCSNSARMESARRLTAGSEWSDALLDLFFRHRGVVNITAATFDATRIDPMTGEPGVGEFGWYVDGVGGLFTSSIVELLTSGRSDRLDRSGEGFLDWSEFVDGLTERMRKGYSKLREPAMDGRLSQEEVNTRLLIGQTTQTPQAFSLGRRAETQGVEVDPFRPNERRFPSIRLFTNSPLEFPSDGEPGEPRVIPSPEAPVVDVPAPPSLRPLRLGVYLADRGGLVVVDSVAQGTPASRTGIQAGDVILRVNDQPVSSVQDFLQKLDAVPPGGRVRLDARSGAGGETQMVYDTGLDR